MASPDLPCHNILSHEPRQIPPYCVKILSPGALWQYHHPITVNNFLNLPPIHQPCLNLIYSFSSCTFLSGAVQNIKRNLKSSFPFQCNRSQRNCLLLSKVSVSRIATHGQRVAQDNIYRTQPSSQFFYFVPRTLAVPYRFYAFLTTLLYSS